MSTTINRLMIGFGTLFPTEGTSKGNTPRWLPTLLLMPLSLSFSP